MEAMQFLHAVAMMAAQKVGYGQGPVPVPEGNLSKDPLWSSGIASTKFHAPNQRQRRKRARQVNHRW